MERVGYEFMGIKRRTYITVQRSVVTTVRFAPTLDRRVCGTCSCVTAVITKPERASEVFDLPRSDIEAAIRDGEVHAAGPEGLCAVSLIRRFHPPFYRGDGDAPIPFELDISPEQTK